MARAFIYAVITLFAGLLTPAGAHALEAVAQGDQLGAAAANTVLQGQIGNTASQLGVTNATVTQQAGQIQQLNQDIQSIKIQLEQVTQTLSNTQTALDTLKNDQGGAGSACGFVQWAAGLSANYGAGSLSSSDGSYIYTGGPARSWPSNVAFPSEVRYHVACKGEALVVNNAAHCPTGYKFSVISYAPEQGDCSTFDGGACLHRMYTGSCIKN